MSLTDNTPFITAVGNDYGYDEIFCKQLECYLSEGDVLIAISASGNSKNIVHAIDYCNKKSCTTIGLLGFDGGKAAEKSDLSIIVKTEKGEFGPVEDMHIIFDHLLTTYIYFMLKEV